MREKQSPDRGDSRFPIAAVGPIGANFPFGIFPQARACGYLLPPLSRLNAEQNRNSTMLSKSISIPNF